MTLKFRLKGLAETFVEDISCPNCSYCSELEQDFKTEMTKITETGIVVVAECNMCGEIFVPENQQVGVINPKQLTNALFAESITKNTNPLYGIIDVKLAVEQLNAVRKNELH